MTKFKNSDRNDLTSLDEAELDTVVGGACFPPIGTVSATHRPNTGWVFKDVFAKPTLGTFH